MFVDALGYGLSYYKNFLDSLKSSKMLAPSEGQDI
jgi:hypothetical protein